MGLNVFFIDDEPLLCEMFSEIYSSENVRIHAFSDHELALAAAEVVEIDIAFIDLRMPGLRGEKIAERLPSSVDCYLVTGEIAPEYTFNFRGVITKPFHNETIRSIIQNKLKSLS